MCRFLFLLIKKFRRMLSSTTGRGRRRAALVTLTANPPFSDFSLEELRAVHYAQRQQFERDNQDARKVSSQDYSKTKQKDDSSAVSRNVSNPEGLDPFVRPPSARRGAQPSPESKPSHPQSPPPSPPQGGQSSSIRLNSTGIAGERVPRQGGGAPLIITDIVRSPPSIRPTNHELAPRMPDSAVNLTAPKPSPRFDPGHASPAATNRPYPAGRLEEIPQAADQRAFKYPPPALPRHRRQNYNVSIHVVRPNTKSVL